MLGLQMLKFCQHENLQAELLNTGDLPLHYAQASKPGQVSSTGVLESLATQLGTTLGENAGYGNIGEPLPSSWTTLRHPDDTFWGLDPEYDPKGETSNQL